MQINEWSGPMILIWNIKCYDALYGFEDIPTWPLVLTNVHFRLFIDIDVYNMNVRTTLIYDNFRRFSAGFHPLKTSLNHHHLKWCSVKFWMYWITSKFRSKSQVASHGTWFSNAIWVQCSTFFLILQGSCCGKVR